MLVLSFPDDEIIIQEFNGEERKFKRRINYFEKLDGIEFIMRHFKCFFIYSIIIKSICYISICYIN